MTTFFTHLVLLTAINAPWAQTDAVELRYRGELTETGRDSDGETVKRFNLYCLVTNPNAAGERIAFLVDERGGGAWPWPERFGLIQLDANRRPTSPAQIRLLYTHEGTPSSIKLQRPLFAEMDKLSPDAKWTSGNTTYTVTGSTKIQELDCWRIESVTNFGLKGELAVDKENGLIVKARRDLTRGRGVPFSLFWELESQTLLEKSAAERLENPIITLAKLQEDLKRAENAFDPELTDGQLKTTASVADKLQQQAEETPYARLAATIRRDLKRQMRRTDDVGKLEAKFVGQAAPKFELQTLDNQKIDPETFQGNVVVLHFWNYKSDPLVEPYGQAAYLDFSYSRYQKLGVQVFGVAVNNSFANDATRGPALQSARKFKDFMNLSFPVAVDNGELIAKFGDPRRVGAKLPLWVVIGADGKITHYKLGFYDINPDEGLRPLDKAVGMAVRAKRNAATEKSE